MCAPSFLKTIIRSLIAIGGIVEGGVGVGGWWVWEWENIFLMAENPQTSVPQFCSVQNKYISVPPFDLYPGNKPIFFVFIYHTYKKCIFGVIVMFGANGERADNLFLLKYC